MIQLRGVLTQDQVATVRRILDVSNWLDGRNTAGQVAQPSEISFPTDPVGSPAFPTRPWCSVR